MNARSLREHLFFSLTVAIALPMLLSIALSNRAYTEGFLAQFERRTALVLDTAGRLLDGKGEALFQSGRLIAGSPDLAAALRAGDRFAAVRLLSNAGFEGDVTAALLDTAGVLLARVPEQYRHPFALSSTEADLVAGDQAGFDLEADGDGWRLIAACPVYSASVPLGRLVLRRRIDAALLRGITDLTGGVLALASGARCLVSDGEALASLPADLAALAPGRRVTRIAESAGRRLVLTAVTIDRHASPFLLVAGVNIDAAHATLLRTQAMILLSGLVGLLFAFLISGYLSAKIARPLEGLADAAAEMAARGLSRPVDLPVSAVREVGALLAAFLAMRDNLRRSFEVVRATNLKLDERLREISLLNRLNAIIAEHSDHERVLPAALELLAKELDVEKCSVMVLTPRRELIVKETWPKHDPIDAVAGHVTLEWGVGVAGIAAAERRIINAPAGATDPRYLRAESCGRRSCGGHEPGAPPDPACADKGDVSGRARNLVAVPLVAEQETVGVLNLVDRRRGAFEPGDYDLLETLARTFSVALAKVILNEVAITDGLTGLFVKRYFRTRLDEEVKRAKRYGHPLTLLTCDLDHFKNLNDTYGHQAGDEILKGFAGRLRECARLDTDIPARIGGEEFAVILPMNGPEGARILAERLRSAVADAPFVVSGRELSVTVSIGIAAVPDHAGTPDDLLRRSDLALYASKHAGRDRVTVFTESLAGKV